MNPKDLERFYSLRERLFALIRHVDDGYHKSYEGAMDVRFCFDNIYEADSVRDIGYVEIELHCYLLTEDISHFMAKHFPQRWIPLSAG